MVNAPQKRKPGRPRLEPPKPQITINLPNIPSIRDYQAPFWFYMSRGGKRAVLCWPRRAGKDEICLHHLACAAHERIGTYWYLLPEYAQARKSMWDAVNPKTGLRRIDDIFPEPIRKTTREHEMMIVFKSGSTFQLVGADNFNALVGSPPIGLVFSEYALTNPAAWAYLSPILEENGGFAIFNSTPRGNNHFKDLYEFAASPRGKAAGWFAERLTNDQTRVFPESKMQELLLEKQAIHGEDYGYAIWRQEYYCSFDAAIPGAIWADCIVKGEAEGRIRDGDIYVPELPVSTGWDLGFTDDTAIWFFQVFGGEVLWLDFYEASGKDIKHYADMLRAKRAERGWNYGTHWLPHDARPRTLAAGGKSILQQMKEEDVGRIAIAPRLDREEGIQAVRATLARSRMDSARCKKGIDALRQYHREWDDELKVYSQNPVHDWASHPADAARTVGVVWKNPKSAQPDRPLMERLLDGNVRGLRFGQLKDQYLARKRAEREMRMDP